MKTNIKNRKAWPKTGMLACLWYWTQVYLLETRWFDKTFFSRIKLWNNKEKEIDSRANKRILTTYIKCIVSQYIIILKPLWRKLQRNLINLQVEHYQAWANYQLVALGLLGARVYRASGIFCFVKQEICECALE